MEEKGRGREGGREGGKGGERGGREGEGSGREGRKEGKNGQLSREIESVHKLSSLQCEDKERIQSPYITTAT